MSDERPILDQVNLITGKFSASLDFYRRLGVSIPDQAVFRTASGPHHANADVAEGAALDIDSTTFA